MEESKRLFQLSPLDHALRLELIAEVHGLSMAEAYFAKIEDLSKKAACLPLLHCYVKDKNTVSAESFMEQIQNMGFLVTPDPFNEMMKLYMSTDQYSKVPLVVQQMKYGNIPLNVLSYNIYMNACSEIFGISFVQKVYKEMTNDWHVKIGWSTYATLANIHTKHGSYAMALSALKAAEDTLSTKNRLGYFFLITLYANLQDKDGVLRVWQSSKKVMGRITCANYMCIILCLLKVGYLEKAESVLASYELQLNRRKYDVRVSNVLLGAYVRSGFIKKAEMLHLHTMKIGGDPNYKTWEILMEGWVKSNEMDKVLDAMNKAFSMLKSCNWRPPLLITMAIFKYFEKHVRIEDARKYVKVLRGLNNMNLLLYKSYLRSHIKAQTPITDVRRMMEIDNISIDEEALSLIHQASSIGNES
ncbi:Pentatricopeptide repeat-containing protein [Zostera marina]|uniref:Pentatricopeptide repeat-containing protein n=1 Tax=Zostera marina TaxID=29655 RepID=A0A0K9PFH0_ZOSMR|nr:Pentatricopeptide repeat-containing protein [Zostera marina]